MLPLLLLTLAAARPLPDPRDQAEGQRATQCIFYYRLQPTQAPVDAARCDAMGYGLEFMHARWAEVASLEQKRAEALTRARAEARLDAAAQAQRAALLEPCRAHFEQGAAAPDGGEPWCARAGLTAGYYHRVRFREGLRARERRATWLKRLAAGGAALGALGLLALAWRRRR